MNSILITICARGGSKGIPGKNIKQINGKPLIYYTLKIASEFIKNKNCCKIILSTDSKEIKDIVKLLDFSDIDLSYCRPDELANDNSGKLDAIKDVLDYSKLKYGVDYEYILDLDVTSPLRSLEDLKFAFDTISRNKTALNLFSVNNAARNPYFNMVEDKGDGFVTLCKKGNYLTRQSAPKVFELNASFYIYRKDFFDSNQSKVINERSIVYIMPHLCFDLDHPIDFEFMTYILEHNKLDFDFLS